jgi:hypothetical protein
MTHQEIQEGELIERYVRHQLAPAERRAFQEHFFACEECFEQVQTTASFIAAVRQASRQGQLAESAAEPASWWASLFSPALGFAAAAALLLALVFGWLIFKQPATPRQEVAHGQQPSPSPEQNTAQHTSPTPAPEKNERPQPPKLPKLEDQRDLLAQNRAPSVLLESARDASASGNQLTLPANATSAILRIEIEPGSTFTSFQFQVFDSAPRLVTTATSGKASARGSVAARVSVGALQAGKYLVKCYGVRDGQRELVGEYDLRVLKL